MLDGTTSHFQDWNIERELLTHVVSWGVGGNTVYISPTGTIGEGKDDIVFKSLIALGVQSL